MDLRSELGEHMRAHGFEAGATQESAGSAASTACSCTTFTASSCVTSMEQGHIQGLLHLAAAVHAWRPRHADGHDILPLARLVQRHRFLHDGTGHDGTGGDGGSSPTAPIGYELCFFIFKNQFFILVHLRNRPHK
jgi:hypothetical protein